MISKTVFFFFILSADKFCVDSSKISRHCTGNLKNDREISVTSVHVRYLYV